MTRRLATVLLATVVALPAAAQDTSVEVHRSAARFDPARCTMQQVHTPAGKMIHNAPIVRCRTNTALAARANDRVAPAKLASARD